VFTDPPAPVQVKVNVLLAAVSAPVLADPAVARLPDQAPEAVHDVALVDDQVRVELAPLVTLIGLADKVTVGATGAAVTVTVAELLLEPPSPVHNSVNILLAAVSTAEVAVPAVARLPDHAPEAVQPVVSVLDQVSIVVPLGATFVGLAVMDTVGAAGVGAVTVTETDPSSDPPSPEQVSEYVLDCVRAPVDSFPDVAMLPDHAPEALQAVAFELDHVSMELAPETTESGLAAIVTLTAGGAGSSPLSSLHAATVTTKISSAHRMDVVIKVCI
jgi:hypothetical protein